MKRQRRGEGGAVIVEAAIGIPVLLLFVFALVDLGMWTLNSNQATNAARDGARIAILDYEQADVVGSDDWDLLVERMESRLDREIDASQLDVTCVDPDGDPVPGGCAAAEPRFDRVRVEVEWDWTLVTPLAAVVGRSQGAATGTATMEISGMPVDEGPISTTSTVAPPPTTAPPADPNVSTTTAPSCSVSSWSLSHDPVKTVGNSGKLQSDLTISFATAGVCTNLSVTITPPDGGSTVVFGCGCGSGPYSKTIDKDAYNFWKSSDEFVLELINDGFVMVREEFEVKK